MNFSKDIAEFWIAFQENAEALSLIATADDPLYDELLAQLQRIDPGLYFEFSVQSGQCELLITADGNQDLFSCVDDVVAAAPNMKGWTIFALKPKLGFPETTEWEGLKIVIADVVFDPVGSGAEVGLRLFVPGLNDDDMERAHNALLRAIDHGLGEREFAETIQYTEVVALEGSGTEYIPLRDLDRFIQWRKQRD